MNAGALRQVVTVLRKSITRDSYGAEVVAWATLITVRGAWQADRRVGDLERFAGSVAREVQRTARTLILRFDADTPVTELDRIQVDGIIYDIERIADVDGQRREWLLNVREVT